MRFARWKAALKPKPSIVWYRLVRSMVTFCAACLTSRLGAATAAAIKVAIVARYMVAARVFQRRPIETAHVQLLRAVVIFHAA